MKILRLLCLILLSVCLMNGCKNGSVENNNSHPETTVDLAKAQTETSAEEDIYLDLDSTMDVPVEDTAAESIHTVVETEKSQAAVTETTESAKDIPVPTDSVTVRPLDENEGELDIGG